MPRTLLNPAQWTMLRELSPDDDGAFLHRVLDAFIQQLEIIPPQLREASVAGDAKQLSHLAHTLKGSAGNVGAEALSDLCLDIENGARQDDLDGIAGKLDSFDRMIEQTRGAVIEWRKKDSA